MALPTLHARYSLPSMAGRFLISFGFASICYYISQLPGINSIEFLLLGAPFLCASVVFLYDLLTAKTRIILSIDEAGFRDVRLSAAVIPWSAVKSMGPYLSSRYKQEIGINIVIAADLWQTLPRRLDFRFWKYVGMGMEAETSANLRTDCLEVDWSEVLRIAGAYTLIRTHDWSQDFS